MSAKSPMRRVVIVTGASSGIGRACATLLARRGFEVLGGVREETAGRSLREESRGKVEPVLLDVTDARSIAAATGHVHEKLQLTGRGLAWELSVVNNAGVGFGGPLEFLPLEDLRAQLEVNVVGQLAVTQAFLRLTRDAGRPVADPPCRVVFMGSMFGSFAWPQAGPYSASKFALEGLAGALRMELAEWRIPVSIVEAGVAKTPIWAKHEAETARLLERLPPEARPLYERQVAAARRASGRAARWGMRPEAVARTVLRCLESSSPKIRYRVGLDARLGALATWALPAEILDLLTLLVTGMPAPRARRRG